MMNYENKNWSYSPFPWLEEELKNYQLNADYKVEYIDGCKHYTIISEKLKKYLEEEWHGKINPDNYGGLCPSSEEILKREFIEGIDYSEETTSNGIKDRKILSERLKKAWKSWWDKKHPCSEADKFADAFLALVTNGKVKSWDDRDPARQWKNTPEQRQNFIAENNPPQFYQVGINREKEKYAAWIKQQSPLTEAELKALNDPILQGEAKGDCWGFGGLGELNSALWWIQKVRQANSEVFSDKHFAWHENFEKELNNPQSIYYKATQALKNAGISLDRLFERVKKGRQIRKIKEQEKPEKDKNKILAKIEDWEISGEYVYNPKTGHLKSAMRNMWCGGDDKHDYFSEYDKVKLTPETYPEVRQAVFNNFLKKMRANKQEWEITSQGLKSKKGDRVVEHKKDDFSPTEWTEIEKEIGNFSVSKSHQQTQNNPTSHRDLIIIISLVGLIILAGLLIIKKRPKKNEPKR